MFSAASSRKLSVVVLASNNMAALERTLSSLRGQAESPDTEVIAVCNFDGEILTSLQERFPFVRSVALPRDATVAELRTTGVHMSNGRIVAFVEDYAFVDEQWCAEIMKAHESRFSIVGGAVENRSPNKPLNWAVYFFDYGKYMPPLQSGITATLSGINVSYKRDALAEVEETFRDGFHETFVHEQLKSKGHELLLAPSAIVYLSTDFVFAATLRNFFIFARSFASKRVVDRTPANRLVFALGSCLLPILLPVRVVLRIVLKQRHLWPLILSVPHLSILMTGWAAGEFYGCLFGEAASHSVTSSKRSRK
ncbi:MAG: glycosyltransferase family 2 protein [Candidatus Acidiferrales bacterium]